MSHSLTTPPRSIHTTQQFVQVERVLATEVDNELVMVDMEKGTYFGLNLISTRIWQLLAEPAAIESMVQQLLTEFEIDAERCRSEVTAFVKQLFDAGLVREVK